MIKTQINHQDKPVVLVVGESDFVDYFLQEALAKLHCQVVRAKPEELVKLALARFDYCFYLPEKFNKSLLRSLARLTEKFAGKLLIGTENFFDQGEFEKLKTWPKLDCRWVVWQEVYGPKMAVKKRGAVSKLVRRAVEGGTISVVDNGSAKIYPVFVADLVYQLTKLIFSPRTKKRAYQLRPPAISCLSAALEVQRLTAGQTKIAFVRRESKKEAKLGRLEEIELKAPVEWPEGLRITWKYFQKRQSSTATEPSTRRLPSGQGNGAAEPNQAQGGLDKKRKFWGLILAGVILLLGAMIFYPAGECYYRLGQIERALTAGNFGQIFKAARSAEANCQKLERLSVRARGGRELAGLLRKNESVFNEINRLGQLIFQEKDLSETKRLAAMTELVTALKPQLQDLYEDLALFNYPGLLPVELAKNLGPARRLVLALSRVVENLPEMTGKGQSKNYLVLLQNNQELRPTGGFIGSLAVVSFSQGQLVDFAVKDVYSLDGQLKGHVEPPAELKKYLGEANWYLRDVNWEADFPAVALKAEWFLEKETGRHLDGVVGFNLTAAEKVMKVLGEVTMTDLSEKINAQNLFERAEYHSEVNFFPGSTQKQDFLGELAQAVFERLRSLPAKESLALAGSFYQALQEKEILLYVNQPQVQAALADLNWHGGVRKSECVALANYSCLTDYLLVVEANVGVNKANYFVTRETTLAVGVAEDKLTDTLTLTYQNNSPAPVFPGGIYKNYLRLLLPLGVKLEGVKIDGVPVDKEMIYQGKAGEKWVVGLPVEVPLKQKRQVTVEYSREITSAWQKPGQYSLLVQKQSGAKEEVFNLKLTPAPGLVGFQFRPEARVEKGHYLWAVPFNQDLAFEAYLTK